MIRFNFGDDHKPFDLDINELEWNHRRRDDRQQAIEFLRTHILRRLDEMDHAERRGITQSPQGQ